MTDSSFTGYSMITLDDAPAFLVFEAGECILAHCGNDEGLTARERLKGMGEVDVSAELYTLTPKQIQLTREFNPSMAMKGAPAPIPAPATSGRAPAGTSQGRTKPKSRGEGETVRTDARVPPLQLPRGRFHSIKRAITLSDLIDEMRETHFSGYCNLTMNQESITFVAEDGICLLVDFYPERGSAALQIMQTSLEDEITAELYTLTPAQMQLALEFNRDYRVSISTKSPVIKMMPQKIPERAVRTGGDRSKPHPPGENADGVDDFEEQILALESMDLDTMTEQFKDNFKDVLTRLDLEYLLDERDKDSDERRKSGEIDG
ncbi:MAG: hypothetical protein QCH35_05445 [Methanomicrobiaceae archaeon]|nr:hypothetical protein [Methanomicrobiaceae archaeon]